jgi:hypothetical protein
MFRLLVVAALCGSLGLPSMAQAQEAGRERVNALVYDFMICVRRTAERLEPSGDAPKDVAEAAVFLCLPKETAAANAAIQAGDMQMMGSLRGTATFYGAGQVVAARLCRKTKDCGLAPLPPAKP